MDSKDDGQVPKPTEALWHAAAGEEPELVVHSQRPGEPDCSYYLKFGRCGYGSKCMFNHPPKPWAGQWRAGEKQGQQVAEYPRRPGEKPWAGQWRAEMNCRFNHPSRKQVYFPAGACKCNHHEIEEVRLNSLGLPLRPGTGLCSYYMQKGICKFGSNCKFHHPNRSESEQEKLNADSQGSSQQNFYTILGDIIKPDPDLSLRHAPPPLDLPVPSYLLQQSSKGKEDKSFSLTQPRQVYSCPQQSGYQQLADSHFEPAKQIRYTRDQLLQQRETQQLVDVSKDILELKQCIVMELHGEDYSWPNNDSNVHTLSYHRYDLADRRERHPRSTAQIPEVASEEKYWDNIDEEKGSYGTSGKQEQFCKHDQLGCFEFDSKPQDKCIKNKLNHEKVQFQQRTGSQCYIAKTYVVKQDKYKDTKPTAIDLFKETHCSSKIGFTESVKKAIDDMEAIVAEPEHDGQDVKSSTDAISEVLPQSSKFLQNVGIMSSSKSSTRVGVSSKVQELEAQLETAKQEKAELWQEMDSLKLQAQESESTMAKQSHEVERLKDIMKSQGQQSEAAMAKQLEHIESFKKTVQDCSGFLRQMITIAASICSNDNHCCLNLPQSREEDCNVTD